MRKLLLLLCALLLLSSCDSAQEVQQNLQQTAEAQAKQAVQQQVDKVAAAAQEQANKAKESFFGGISQTIGNVIKAIGDWWSHLWGSQPAPSPNPQPNPNPNPNPNPQPDNSTYVVGDNGARGRDCPKLTCNIITTFKARQEIQVTGTKEGDLYSSSTTWLIVAYKDTTVFVHSSLASEKIPPVDIPADALLPFEGTNNYTGGPHVEDDMTPCREKDINLSNGIDFSAAGTDKHFEVLAISGGEVVAAQDWDGKSTGRGNYVRIKHPNGSVSEYWHLSRISDEIKQLMKGKDHTVIQGFPLGFAGDTGNQTEIHLHLWISRGWHGQSINGWTIWMHLKTDSKSTGFNYQGSATKGNHKIQPIALSTCKEKTADATVDEKFDGKEEKNNTEKFPNTLFAEDGSSGPLAPMESDNHRRTK